MIQKEPYATWKARGIYLRWRWDQKDIGVPASSPKWGAEAGAPKVGVNGISKDESKITHHWWSQIPK